MNTVKEILKWKESKGKRPLEKMFPDEIKKLGWDKTDVLYSFLGIYVIGLKAYYPNEFRRTDYQIMVEKNRKAYANKYVSENYQKFGNLNELEELKNFISYYLTIGNLIPIWPGGNVHKGQSQCFDIPEIYFIRHKKWADALTQIYQGTYMEDILENRSKINLNYLLDINEKDYKNLLKDIVGTIKSRNRKITSLLETI